MKIKENLKAVIVMAIIVAVVSITPIASASDWQQFQKNNINIGYTTDAAPVYNPQLAWWNQTGTGKVDVTPIVGDGDMYVLDQQGVLWSFDAITGAVNWHTSCAAGTGGGFEISTPAYHDGIIYVAVSGGNLQQGAGRINAVNASNGVIREYRDYGLDTYQINTPVRYADGKVYFGNWKGSAHQTDDYGTYYCVNAANVSDLIWSRTAPYKTGYYWAGAAIVGNYIIYGDDTANVTCLYKDNGTFVDYVNVSEAPFNINNPVEEIRSSITWNESTGRIYFTGKKPSAGGHAYAVGFDPNTGHFNTTDYWVTDIGYSTSTPVVYNGRVYVCIGGVYQGESYALRCLSESDGSILYNYSAGSDVSQSSPAVSVVDGHVYIYFTTNVHNGSAYCIEDTDNDFVLRWKWNPPYPDDQHILQGMAIADGMVYFGTDYGRVYALKEGQEQFDIPIYSGKNLIAIPLIQDDPTLAAVFGDDPANWDKVSKFVHGEGYKTAQYYGGIWYDANLVEPIEPEVGYEYERQTTTDYTRTVVGTRCTGTISTPIYTGKNLIGYVNFTNTNLASTFNSPANWDKVSKFVHGEGYKTAQYYGGVWYDANLVEPIEAGVGYQYERKDAMFWWIYEA
jgi:outer membrane protein assembly factor BamB